MYQKKHNKSVIWITNPAAVFLPWVFQDELYSIPQRLNRSHVSHSQYSSSFLALWDVAKNSQLNITESKTAFLALNWPLQLSTSDSRAVVNILVMA